MDPGPSPLALSGDLRVDPRTSIWRAFDSQTTAETLQALAHAWYPQSASSPQQRIETHAIIGDLQHRDTRGDRDPHFDACSMGVLQHVIERLLRHSIQLLLRFWRQPLFAFAHEIRADPRSRFYSLESRADGRGQSVLLEQCRPEVKQQKAHLPERLLCRIADFAQIGSCRLGLSLVHGSNCRLGVERNAIQRLRHGIVELTRKSLTFVERGGALGLFVQMSILDRQAGTLRQ